MSKIYEYTVLSSQMTNESTLQILLHTAPRQRPIAYEPGQYAAISFWRHGRPTPARCFSITSSPTDEPKLQFAIRVKGGYTKAAAQALKPGSKVMVEGPFGNFVFNSERDRSSVMLAGGIGITPFMSMLRYASRLQMPNDILLLYSCHTQDDVPFLEELLQIQRVNPRLTIKFVVSNGGLDRLSAASAVSGHIDAALLNDVLGRNYQEHTYFICGPGGFMSGMSKLLAARGVTADSILTEAFQQGQKGPRSLRHNVSMQVYALSGLGLALTSATIMIRDVVTPAQAGLKNSSQNQFAAAPVNSRQTAVDHTIAGLQPSDSSGQGSGSASSSSGGSAGSSSPAGTSSGSGSAPGSTPSSPSGSAPKPGTAPAPTPTPSPSPAPTPSPAPQPKPAPVVAPVLSLGASASQITSGQSVTLSWSINGTATAPVSCSASGGWAGSKAAGGSQAVSPAATTTYTLACSNSGGSSTQSVTITVHPACVSTPSNPC